MGYTWQTEKKFKYIIFATKRDNLEEMANGSWNLKEAKNTKKLLEKNGNFFNVFIMKRLQD